MTVLRIGTVPIFVSDQQRALQFYREALGCRVVLDYPIGHTDRWLALALDEQGPELLLFRPGMFGEGSERLIERVGVWTGIVFITNDIENSYAVLMSRGVAFASEPRRQGWGGLETCFSDPDGNQFQLVQRPPGMRGAPRPSAESERQVQNFVNALRAGRIDHSATNVAQS